MNTMIGPAGMIGGTVLMLALALWPSQTQAEFPDFKDLSKANVSLNLEGFRFASGLRLNDKGKPNGHGTELVRDNSCGSGFIVKNDGTLVTNYHVVRRMLRGRAVFQSGATFDVAHLRIYSRSNDLALLKIRTTEALPTVQLGDANSVQPLDKVLAVGNTLCKELAVSDGIVNQVIRDRKYEDKPVRFRHSATIAPGNSGGALYRDKEVIGINFLQHRTYPIYYAIPIDMVKPMLQKYGDRLAPLEDVFPTDTAAIMKQAEQVGAKSGQVEAKSGPGPALWKVKVDAESLTDFAVLLKTAQDRDLDLGIWDEEGKLMGYGSSNAKGQELVLLSSTYDQTITIGVLNFDETPADFGLTLYRIVW
jgi:S1-C subfamily serine protease